MEKEIYSGDRTEEVKFITEDQARSDFYNNKTNVINELMNSLVIVDTSIPRVLKGHFDDLDKKKQGEA